MRVPGLLLDPTFGAALIAVKSKKARGFGFRSSQGLFDRCEEFFDGEWLSQETGRTHMLRQAGVGIASEVPRNEDDGKMGPKALVGFTGGIARETAGQIDIKQDEIDRMGPQQVKAGEGSRGGETLVVLLGKGVAQNVCHGRIILNDQDNHVEPLMRIKWALRRAGRWRSSPPPENCQGIHGHWLMV